MSDKNSENKKVTQQQKAAIVDFMQQNYSFLMGKFTNLEGRNRKNQKWEEFGDTLNQLGPPTKDLAKWKKTWFDMKAETKKKFQTKRQNLLTSGAGPIDVVFTPLDERIINICGKKTLDGDAEVDEIGFDVDSVSNEANDADENSNSNEENGQSNFSHSCLCLIFKISIRIVILMIFSTYQKYKLFNFVYLLDVVLIESEQKTLAVLKTPLKTPLKTTQKPKMTPKNSRKRLFTETEDAMFGEYFNFLNISFFNAYLFIVSQFGFVDFPGVDETSNTPSKRAYRSQINQVDLALALQEKQNILMERMITQNDRVIEQNDAILDELKQIKDLLSKQNNSFFHY